MMNILYISAKKNWGGVASWMVKTATGLEEKGHKVFILSAKKSRFTTEAPEHLNIIPWSFGFDYHPKTICYIYYLIKKHNIDLIVTNIEKEIAAGGFVAKMIGIPNVRRVGRHDDFNDAKSKIRFRHETFVDHCIIPCNALFHEAVTHSSWLKKEQFTTIYNGRDVQVFTDEEIRELRASWGASDETIVIGLTSQLAAVKRVDVLIQAYADVLNQERHIRLVISGFGNVEDELKQQVQSLNIADKVHFAGFTSTPLLTAAGYDIAVSTSSNEGFPNTIVEYMASGAAVISTDVGGVREIIDDGENGVLIPVGNSDALVQKLTQLLDNSVFRKALAEKGQQRIAAQFTEERMVNEVEAYFQNILKI